MWSAKETSQGRKQDLGARIVASLRLGPRKQSIEEVRNWKYLPSAGCLCLVISDSHQKSKTHKAEATTRRDIESASVQTTRIFPTGATSIS
jgi:hypothetical protein